MAKRKSLLAQMYAAHQKAKLDRQRGRSGAKSVDAEERKIAAQQRRERERAIFDF